MLNQKDDTKKQVIFALIIGATAGFINGMFGGGGGMIVVPLLIWLLGYPVKNAHATAILIILPFSVLSGLMYSSFGIVRLSYCLPVTLGVTAGGALGSFLLSGLSGKKIVVVFSLVMLAAGIKMLVF